jgi:excinuclease ABC subunit A
MSSDHITIAGAREHNLKNITVRLPRNRLTVITGLSGSGKSSLAFDTLYAEGRRRYVESLSAYARQFLEQMHKPEVDYIDGLAPAIAIEQRTAGSNPRSIVATSTEIHDYLRLLFANIGHQHCPKCGRPVSRQTAEEIVDRLMQTPDGARLILLAPLVRRRKGQHLEVLESAQRQGFVRMRIDGRIVEIDQAPKLNKRLAHTLELVVDRIEMNAGIRSRLTDSVELALRHGQGEICVISQTGDKKPVETIYSENNACPDCGISFETLSARHFSFNSPQGACPACAGLGMRLVMDADLVIPNPALSISDGAIHAWRRGGRRLIIYYNALLRALAKHYDFSLDTPFQDLPDDLRKILLHGSGAEDVQAGYWRGGSYHRYAKPFEGILPNLTRRHIETDSELVRKKLEQYMSRRPCPDCQGARLKPEVIACQVAGQSIVDVCRLSVSAAREFFSNLQLPAQEEKIAREVIKEIRQRLEFLHDVGLDYLTLDRESGTLSGGEAQRIRLATQIGSGLVGVLYVLDEPSIGLHHRDNQRLISTLQHLRDIGNTVIVVEHDEDTIRQADYVVDMGPGAGRNGGEVVFAGPAAELPSATGSLTAQYLNGSRRIEIPSSRRRPTGRLSILGASANNLRNIDVHIPLGVMVCVTGVSGSGKSTLIDEILRRALFRHFYNSKERPGAHRAIKGLENINKAIVINQEPIGRTPRSNPATYTDAFTIIRQLFTNLPASKARGFGPGRYSFNVKGGRCEKCRGDGIIKIEMHFLPDVYVPCEQCHGRRYNSETLEVRYNGRNIAEVLKMTVDEALEFFSAVPRLRRKLQTMSDVGLGYIQLGQPATTLSGGEAQRLKLSAELALQDTGRTIYLLDEPTTGLHFADIQKLLEVLTRLRDAGNSVLVIEHNPDVIKSADYIIDLGPDGGDNGGQVVAVGTPEEVANCAASHTGRMLRKTLGMP